MKIIKSESSCLELLRRACLLRQFLAGVVIGLMMAPPSHAAEVTRLPSWWVDRKVIRPEVTDDHFAAINAGQFKHAVIQAIQEMNVNFTGGAGLDLNALVSGWNLNPAASENLQMVNAGQVKAVMEMWYQRMNEVHGTTGYPWAADLPENAFEAINSGQLKRLLQVDVKLPWTANLAQGFGDAAGPQLTAPSGALVNRLGVLAAPDHYLRNPQLGLSARGQSPVAIPASPELITNDSMATVNGSFKVGADGAANYTIPLALPKGVAGMKPDLALQYNSNGGDGILGMGWSFSGLVVINRGPATVDVDGFYDPADLDGNDRAYLDGDRLLCVEGAYWQEGSRYRTAKEQFSQVIYHRAEDWFEVRTKSGLTLELGRSNNSGIGPWKNGAAISHPRLSWCVSRVKDRQENFWEVFYSDVGPGDESGEDTAFLPDIQPTQIRYTGHRGGDGSPANTIRLVYEQRSDPYKGYRSGFLVRKTSRLTGIQVETLGTPVRSWKLSYDQGTRHSSRPAARLLLTSIEETAGSLTDSLAPRLPRTWFRWEEGARLWQGTEKQPDLPEVLQKVDYDGSVPFGETTDLRMSYRGRGWEKSVPNVTTPFKVPNQWFSKQPSYVDLDGDGMNEILINHRGVLWAESFSSGDILRPSYGYSYQNEFRQVFKRKTSSATEWGAATQLPVERSTPFELKVSGPSIAQPTTRWDQVEENTSQCQVTLTAGQLLSESQFPYLTTAAGVPTGAFLMDVNTDGLMDIVSAGTFDELLLNYDGTTVTPGVNKQVQNPRGVWMNAGGRFEKVTSNDWAFPWVPTEIITSPGGAIQPRPATPPAGMILSGLNEEFKEPEFARFKENDLGWRVIDMDGDGFTDIIRAGQGYEASGWLATAASAPDSTPSATGRGALSHKGRQLCFGLRNKGPNAPAGQRWELINPADTANSIWKLPLPLVAADGTLDMGRQLIDLNGDNLPDFIAQKRRTSALAGALFTTGTYDEYDLEVWLNRGAEGWEYQAQVGGSPNPWTLEGQVLAFGMENQQGSFGRFLEDINGDGLPDLVISLSVSVTGGASNTQSAVFINTGNGWGKKAGVAVNFDGAAPPQPLLKRTDNVPVRQPYLLMDLSGDGRPEFIHGLLATGTAVPGLSGTKVGRTQFLHPLGSWVPSADLDVSQDWNLPHNMLATDTFVPVSFTEVNGDGVMDVFRYERLASTAEGYATSGERTYLRCGRSLKPRIQEVVNGLGVPIRIAYGELPALACATQDSPAGSPPVYSPVTEPHYVIGSNGQPETLPYPMVNQTPLATVVTSSTTTNGLEASDGSGGGTVSTFYYYAGLRTDALKGSLGFEKMETASSLSRLRQRMIYSQSGELAGLPLENITYSLGDDGTTRILAHVKTRYGLMDVLASTEAAGRFSRFAYASEVDSRSWSPEAAYLGGTTTTRSYHASGPLCGLLLSEKVVQDELTDVAEDDRASTLTYDYEAPVSADSLWRFGEVKKTTLRQEAPEKPAVERSSAFVYHGPGDSVGLLQKSTTDPGTSFSIETEHVYDSSGNLVKSIVSAGGDSQVSESWMDASRRFPAAHQNALGHTVVSSFDPVRSVARSQSRPFAGTAPSGTSHGDTPPDPPQGTPAGSSHHDLWGIPKVLTGPDGLRSVVFTKSFKHASLPRCRYYIYRQTEGSCPVITYHDRHHRPMLVERTGFNGETLFTEIHHDEKGRVVRQSMPCFAGADLPAYSVTDYDDFDRPVKVTRPDGGWIAMAYEGLKTTTTNHAGQTRMRRTNQRGQVIESRGIDGRPVHFTYTADSQVESIRSVLANDGEQTITIYYGLNRQKSWVNRPGAGWDYYLYDAFGRVRGVRDGNNKWTVYRYDKLNRVTCLWTGYPTQPHLVNDPNSTEARVETVYDAAEGGIGQPHRRIYVHEFMGTVTETHAYDALGRATGKTTELSGQSFFSGSYSSSILYHPAIAPGYGAVDTIQSEGGFRQKLRYNAFGYLSQVDEDGGSGSLLWKGLSYDASGRVLEEWDGNGIATRNRYHPTRGFVESSLRYAVGGGGPVCEYQTQVNNLGQVAARRLVSYGAGGSLPTMRTESFSYDERGRLSHSQVVGQPRQDFTYDDADNLKTKTGVGTYTLDAQKLKVEEVNDGSGERRRYLHDPKGRQTAEVLVGGGANGTDQTLREILYHGFDQPMRIRHYASEELSSDLVTAGEGWDRQCEIGFYYGPDLQRVVQTKRKGQMFTKVLYLDGLEVREVRQGGYNAPATLIEREERSGFGNGVKVRRWTAANPEVPVVAYEFAVKDHLGSDNGVYDGSGRLQNQRGVLEAGGRVRTEQQSYDAWGARRDGESWAPARGQLGRTVATDERREGSNVPRGYTGHEALDDVGLVHMNGRLYDPALGRMCSPDPFVGDAEDAASYNRYSYVGNNPLGATDPTGYVGETATQLPEMVVVGYRDNWLDRIMDSVSTARSGAMLLQKQQARQYAASMNYVTEAQVRALVLARQMASSQTVMNGVRVQGPLGGLGDNVSPQYAINGGGFSLVLRQSSLEAGTAAGAVPGVPLAVEEADGPVGGFLGDAILNTGLLEEAAYGWSQGDWRSPMGIAGKLVNGVGMVAGVADAGVNVATLGVKAMVLGVVEKLGRESLEAALKGVVKGSVGGSKGLGNQNPLFKNALQSFKKSDLSNVGRALTKHPEVVGATKDTLRQGLRTDAAINNAAHEALKNIMRNGVTTTPTLGRYGPVTQIQIPGGFGARWNSAGEFIGFINP